MVTVALQQGINGIVFGSLYVLVALGLTLIYGVLVQINFAHADVVTIGAFAAYFFTFAFGGNYLISIGVALMVGAALGWLVNAAIFAPLRERGSELLPLIATIGVSILLQNAMLLWFGPIPYAFDSPYSNKVIRLWGGTFITLQNLIIVLVSALTIVLLYAFMKFTMMGKALRAVAQDRETAGLMGINPNQLIMLTFVIAGARWHGRRHARAHPRVDALCRYERNREGFCHRDHRRVRQRRGDDYCRTPGWSDRKLHDPVRQSRTNRHRGLHAAAADARITSDRTHRRKA